MMLLGKSTFDYAFKIRQDIKVFRESTCQLFEQLFRYSQSNSWEIDMTY